MSAVNVTNVNKNIEVVLNKDKKIVQKIDISSKDDVFEKAKADGSCDGKFTVKEAAKNFLMGVVSPLKAIKEHPFMALGTVVLSVSACTLVPVLTSIMSIGFGAMAVAQLAKGCYSVVKEYKNGNYDESEKAFQKIGAGAISTATSVAGLKQSAKIAAEAKVMQQNGVKALSDVQKAEISSKILEGGILNALKENFSLIFTKSGRKAVINQFKPSSIKTRALENIDIFKTNRKTNKPAQSSNSKSNFKAKTEEFKKSPEGIRRSNLTDEQIETEVKTLFDKAFDELEVPKEYRPQLTIVKKGEGYGGCYSRSRHSMEFNIDAYKAGVFEMDDVIMHEATHCKEALYRAQLPPDEAASILKNELKNRIMNGESEEVVYNASLFGNQTMTPPKLTDKMKTDFINLADDMLYNEGSNFTQNLQAYCVNKKCQMRNSKYCDINALHNAEVEIKPLLDKLQKMLDLNPEFVAQYSSKDDALQVLAEYSLSHNLRFRSYANVNIPGVRFNELPKMSPEQLQHVKQSFIDGFETFEGNARVSSPLFKIAPTRGSFNQYQFSPEEVLAQQNGNKFLIKNLTAKLDKMKQAGTLTADDEAFITSAIEKAKMIVEFKTKGLEYYKNYTKLINNQNDADLAQIVKSANEELIFLQNKIYNNSKEVEQIVAKIPEFATKFPPISSIITILSEIDTED